MRVLALILVLFWFGSAQAGCLNVRGTSGADRFPVTCGIIKPVPSQSTFSCLIGYHRLQGDWVDGKGNVGSFIIAKPAPNSGLNSSDRVVTYYTQQSACPGGIGIFVIKSYDGNGVVVR